MSMNDAFPTDRRGNWAENAQQWQKAMTFVNKATSALSISQMIIPLEDLLDLLLDAALSATQQETRLSEIKRSFAQRWNQVAQYTISGETKRNSQKILMDRTYDLGGTVSFGRELADIFWAALADLDNDRPTTEATDLFPAYESVRPFLRVMATRWGETYLPVIAFSPLVDEEWAVLLADLNQMIDLALQIEGVLIMWLIGSFVTDASGRRTLRPRLSYGPPPQGTRAKQLKFMLGTNYHEIKALQASGRPDRRRLRATEEMTAHWSKHQVTIQLAADVNEYELFHRADLVNLDAEISHRIVMAEAAPQRDRTAVVQPRASEEPRPTVGPAVTKVPRPKATPAERGEVTAEADPKRDAEELRRKGALAKMYNVALAKKYLLASTMLDNSSVDVWLELADMTDNEEEKAWFRKEAQRLLGR